MWKCRICARLFAASAVYQCPLALPYLSLHKSLALRRSKIPAAPKSIIIRCGFSTAKAVTGRQTLASSARCTFRLGIDCRRRGYPPQTPPRSPARRRFSPDLPVPSACTGLQDSAAVRRRRRVSVTPDIISSFSRFLRPSPPLAIYVLFPVCSQPG